MPDAQPKPTAAWHGTEAEHFPKPRKPRHYPAKTYPWLVRYNLAYDGGGSEWIGYYRGRRRARLAIWWHMHIASWGGTADLIRREVTR